MTILAFADVQGFQPAQPPPASIVGWGRDRNFLPAHPEPEPVAHPERGPPARAELVTIPIPAFVAMEQISIALSEAEAPRTAIREFYAALDEARELSRTMVAEDEASPMDKQTVDYAVQSLLPIIKRYKLPPPLMLPLQNAGIGVEWHTADMNIELRFRKPYHVYAVLEDARGAIQEYHGRDPDLVRASLALACLNTRLVR
jgi:hypothetical protein